MSDNKKETLLKMLEELKKASAAAKKIQSEAEAIDQAVDDIVKLKK